MVQKGISLDAYWVWSGMGIAVLPEYLMAPTFFDPFIIFAGVKEHVIFEGVWFRFFSVGFVHMETAVSSRAMVCLWNSEF